MSIIEAAVADQLDLPVRSQEREGHDTTQQKSRALDASKHAVASGKQAVALYLALFAFFQFLSIVLTALSAALGAGHRRDAGSVLQGRVGTTHTNNKRERETTDGR